MLLEEIIKTAPGFIGDTARNYARLLQSFFLQGTTDIEAFNKAFTVVLIKRSINLEDLGNESGNLLTPFHKNGIERVHQCFNEINIGNELKYKLDLPTMVFYSMLLESLPMRKVFEKGDEVFFTMALRVTHKEVTIKTLHQKSIEEDEFVQSNIARVRDFVALHQDKLKETVNNVLNSMLFKGNKKVDLGGDK